MQREGARKDECVILIKAQPHRSSSYFETVCCAGVGRDRKWRRQYPVPFRILKEEQKFGRWTWIKYEYVAPKDDRRRESQKVLSHTLETCGTLRASERANFLSPLVRSSLVEADAVGDSLALVRPRAIAITAKPKSPSELAGETAKHTALAAQLSLLEGDSPAEPLKPCRMQFLINWTDQDGKTHKQECDDWETSAAFNRFERQYGERRALEIIREKYEEQYFKAGLVLGFSTHSRRNAEFGTKNQWLLVGLLRLNETDQGSLF